MMDLSGIQTHVSASPSYITDGLNVSAPMAGKGIKTMKKLF